MSEFYVMASVPDWGIRIEADTEDEAIEEARGLFWQRNLWPEFWIDEGDDALIIPEGEWQNPNEVMPEPFKNVIVAREGEKYEPLIVEQGMWMGDRWKVYGTRVKTVKYWTHLPDPPEEDE